MTPGSLVAAQERPAGEPPEYGDSLRRFLIAMLMVGAVRPERVVERVVAEVEREARTR